MTADTSNHAMFGRAVFYIVGSRRVRTYVRQPRRPPPEPTQDVDQADRFLDRGDAEVALRKAKQQRNLELYHDGVSGLPMGMEIIEVEPADA